MVKEHIRSANEGVIENLVEIRDPNYMAIAICSSKIAMENLAKNIRDKRVPKLYVGGFCLGLGVLRHPKGWPYTEGVPISFFKSPEFANRNPLPVNEAELSSLSRTGFVVLETIPEFPYQHIEYRLVSDVWMKDKRVGIRFNQGEMEGGLCRINFITKSRDTAGRLAGAFAKQNIQALKVNGAVRAIIQEIQPVLGDFKLRIEGIHNLDRKQIQTLERIGIKGTPNKGYITNSLRWEHARMLAAVRLF